eukprot:6204157-Pleurochrysis_carterae.AAC.7
MRGRAWGACTCGGALLRCGCDGRARACLYRPPRTRRRRRARRADAARRAAASAASEREESRAPPSFHEIMQRTNSV